MHLCEMQTICLIKKTIKKNNTKPRGSNDKLLLWIYCICTRITHLLTLQTFLFYFVEQHYCTNVYKIVSGVSVSTKEYIYIYSCKHNQVRWAGLWRHIPHPSPPFNTQIKEWLRYTLRKRSATSEKTFRHTEHQHQ